MSEKQYCPRGSSAHTNQPAPNEAAQPPEANVESDENRQPPRRLPSIEFGVLDDRDIPMDLQCQFCHTFVTTRPEYKNGKSVWMCCMTIAFLGCIAGCCVLPFFDKSMKDVVHRCPECLEIIAIHKCPICD